VNVKIKTTDNVSVMKSRAAFIAQMGGTTRVLNAELKKTIIQVKAVDTGRMRNTVRVKITYDFQREMFYIQSSDMSDQIFYYLYVDQGTINIRPRDITDKTLNKPNVQASLDKLYGKWIDYLTDRQFE
jgi:hypothetical protein